MAKSSATVRAAEGEAGRCRQTVDNREFGLAGPNRVRVPRLRYRIVESVKARSRCKYQAACGWPRSTTGLRTSTMLPTRGLGNFLSLDCQSAGGHHLARLLMVISRLGVAPPHPDSARFGGPFLCSGPRPA